MTGCGSTWKCTALCRAATTAAPSAHHNEKNAVLNTYLVKRTRQTNKKSRGPRAGSVGKLEIASGFQLKSGSTVDVFEDSYV